MEPASPPIDPLPLIAAELLTALCEADGHCVRANDAWVHVFGDPEALWDRLPPDDARFAREYLSEAARGQLVSHQVFLVASDTPERPTPVLLHFYPLPLPDAVPGRMPVLVTGEVLREPVSWAQEQSRRRRTEMLGQMAMGVAHDFNNLLTTLLGHAELLRAQLASGHADPHAAREHLRAMERAATDGASLVRKIQQYIRHEKRERFEPVELHRLAEEVITLTRPYWYNEPRRSGIAIVLDADLHPLPPTSGYPTELREVLVNLVLNAVQAMPAGGTLRVRTRRDAQRGAVVEVEDTGVGMTERVRRRIFEPLFTTKGARGTGMGLTVVNGIVQEHGGRIEVESQPGRGTLFRLIFPFAAEDPAPIAAEAPAPPVAARPARLLVVDDEPMVRAVTARLLGLKGHTVAQAPGGHEALAMLETDTFDLVVTDLSMPEMSGRELAALLHERHPALPVLLLTGDTDADAESEHVRAVIKKPFKLDALEAVIQRALADA